MYARIAVLALLLLAPAAFAAEIPLTQPVHEPAAQSQFGAAAASDGDGYLVVWSDGRASGFETRATRVTRDGEVLDPTGIHIPVHAIEPVRVVWTGTSYLLVWSTYGPDATWALRMNRDGAIVDGPRILIDGARFSSVAKNDTHVVVAYMAPPSIPNEHRALFLSPDAVEVADVKLAARQEGAGPQVAWNGSHFAAVWLSEASTVDNTFTVSGIRFDITGALDPAPRTLFVNGPALDLSVASDGTDFVLLAREYATDVYHSRRISADLATIGQTYDVPGSQASSASLIWSGASYLVLERGWNKIDGVRLDREGRPIDIHPVTLDYAGDNASVSTPVAATNGRDLLVAWSGELSVDFNQPDTDIFGTIVSAPTLSRRTRSLLTVSAPRQSRPLVASGGTSLLAVWHEKSGLYAKRLGRDGSTIDATPIRLSQRGSAVAVVFNGRDYVVVWSEEFARVTMTARVPREGALRADGGTRIDNVPYAQPLAAASDGTTTLLLWKTTDGLKVSRLGADAAIVDTLTVPSRSEEFYIDKATLAPNGSGTFLLAWEEIENTQHYHTTFTHVRGARITSSLLNLDPAGIEIATGTRYDNQPAVTWNGSEWLVVWTHLNKEIRGRVVAANGTLPGSEHLVVADATLPSVTWDGTRYVFTWLTRQTLRTAWTARLGTNLVAERDLGKVVDHAPAALVPVARGTVAAAYARVEDEPRSGGVPRAFVNLMSGAIKRRAVR